MHYTAAASSSSHASGKPRGSASGYAQSTHSSHADQSTIVYSQHPTTWAPRLGSVPLPDQTSGSQFGFSTRSSQTNSSPLHPVLQHDRSGRLLFNISQPLTKIQFKLGEPVNPRDLALATRATQMTIVVQGLPQPCNIQNPHGVTLQNVLEAIYAQLQQHIGQTEFLTFPPDMQKGISTSFRARTAGDRVTYEQGIKRLDCLGSKILFVGLSRATDGSDSWVARFVSSFGA